MTYTGFSNLQIERCGQDIQDLDMGEGDDLPFPEADTVDGPVLHRETLGRLVRRVWVAWARQQSDPKPSWLVPWERLDGDQREVDMRIGEAVFAAATLAALLEDPDQTRGTS